MWTCFGEASKFSINAMGHVGPMSASQYLEIYLGSASSNPMGTFLFLFDVPAAFTSPPSLFALIPDSLLGF